MKILSGLLPVIVFLLALSLRLYRLPFRAIFTADEEYQATYAKTIVDDFHPVWIGVSAADTGFYLGPYFTYLTAGLLKLSHGNPLILNYAAGFIGATTALMLYLLGASLFGKRVGLFAAIFYAFSPLMVYFDQRYWNPNPIPLVTVFLLWCLYKLKDNGWWLVGVAFALGAIWHVHLSLVPLILLAVIYVWKLHSKITFKVWLVSFCMLLLMLLPLFIFDYNHNWSNLLTPIRMIKSSSHRVMLSQNFQLLGTTLTRSLYLKPGFSSDTEVKFNCPGDHTTVPILVSFILLLILLYFLLRLRKNRLIIGGSIVLLILAFVFYPGPVASYYALGLLPLFFLSIAHTFKKAWWLILPIFLFFSVKTLVNTDSGYSLAVKKQLIGQVMHHVGNSPFAVEEVGTCHAYAGWRFLFMSYARTPDSSSADASLSWLYPGVVTNTPVYHVTLGVKSEITQPSSPLFIEEAGHYTAYIEKQNQ